MKQVREEQERDMEQWSNVETAMYSSIFTAMLGLIFYFKLWWNGPGASWRVTRWFFGILAVVVLIVGVSVYFLS
jgi:hypothetical protein